jgi:hypothetical protein
MSSDVAILLYGSSFLRVSDSSLDSELAFATRVMRESRRTGVAPFRFAFLSAFSVPRSRHPRPSDARSPSQNPLRASTRCGLLPQSKFGSPSADSIQSPREWVATAPPLGKHVPQTADKPKVGSRLHGFPCFPYSVISMACFPDYTSTTSHSVVLDYGHFFWPNFLEGPKTNSELD